MADTIATRALSEPDRLLKRRRLDELLHRITHGAGAGTSSRPTLNNNIYEKYYLKNPVAVVAVPHHYPYNLYASEDMKERVVRGSPSAESDVAAPSEHSFQDGSMTPERLSPDIEIHMHCEEVFDAEAISNAPTPTPISPVFSEEYGPIPEFDLFALFGFDENYKDDTVERELSPEFGATEQVYIMTDDHPGGIYRRERLEEQEIEASLTPECLSAALEGQYSSTSYSAPETEQHPMDNEPSLKRLKLPQEQETPLDLSTKKEYQTHVSGAWGDHIVGRWPLAPLRQIVLPEGLKGAPLTLALSPANAVVEQVPNDTGLAFPCLDCGQLFCLQDRLAKHIASRHRRPGAKERAARAYRCDVCLSTFARSDMLTRHARLHTGVKPYSCGECGQVFTRSDHLATHQRTHTGEKPYKCSLCEYAACRRDMISRHMRTHSKHYPFTAPGAARGRRGRTPVHP